MATKQSRIYPCINPPDSYCFICGLFLTIEKRRNISDEIRKLYFDFFNIHINQDNNWTPKFICIPCQSNLQHWSKKSGKLPFGSPMIWREPFNHSTDCYFCAVSLKGINWNRRHDQKWYGNVSAATKTVPHSAFLPVPVPSSDQSINSPSAQSVSIELQASRTSSFPSAYSEKINLFRQEDLDDLVRDLNLSKQLSELLASRLKDRNMLEQGKFNHSQFFEKKSNYFLF